MISWLRRLENQDIAEEDKKLFRKFAEDATLHNIGERRIDKYRTDLTIAKTMTGMGFAEMVKNQKALEEAISRINTSKQQYAVETKRDAKRTLGSLYCFVNLNSRSLQVAPLELRLIIQHKAKASDKRMAKPVITREEIREIVKRGATGYIDRAILWLLFESGMRMGEFEQLKVGDIQHIEEGLMVKVPAGKTGERTIIVVEATQPVLSWLEKHPQAKNPSAPLWISGITNEALGAPAIGKHIRNMVKRLNNYREKNNIPKFTKNINPHNFRHSRATELGGEPGMTEQIMCKYFGWELDSAMPKTYIHLTDEQVKRAVLRTYGKAKKEEEKQIITDWVCSRCATKNALDSNFCNKCGSSKEGKVLSQTEMLTKRVDMLESLLEALDPDVYESLKDMPGRAKKKFKHD